MSTRGVVGCQGAGSVGRGPCFNLKAPPQAAQDFHCKPQHGGSSASDYWYELSGEEGQSEEEEHSKDTLKDYLALDQLKQTKTSTEQDAVDSCVVEKAPGAVSERGSDGPAVPRLPGHLRHSGAPVFPGRRSLFS